MEIDPIDDGPAPSRPNSKMATSPTSPIHITQEEEARQAIDMLRGDDVSGRVAAANRLEAVAGILGEERTRKVCCSCCCACLLGPFFALVGLFLVCLFLSPPCVRYIH